MKRFLGLTLSVIFITSGLFILTQLISPLRVSGKGALQVTSNIKALVTLNDKSYGSTNLCKCTQGNLLAAGRYTLVLTPEDKSVPAFTAKIDIKPGVLTAVERNFLPGTLASTSILTLEKTASKEPQLVVTSLPDGAMVTLDGNPQSVTPFLLASIAASEHELEIQKAGFAKKTLKIRTVPGYKLVANIFLGTESNEGKPSITPTAPTLSSTPIPVQPHVKILNTPTGFLRVREQASVSSNEIARVLPGETYPFIDEQNGWFKIQLKTGAEGWVSSGFAEKTSL